MIRSSTPLHSHILHFHFLSCTSCPAGSSMLSLRQLTQTPPYSLNFLKTVPVDPPVQSARGATLQTVILSAKEVDVVRVEGLGFELLTCNTCSGPEHGHLWSSCSHRRGVPQSKFQALATLGTLDKENVTHTRTHIFDTQGQGHFSSSLLHKYRP